LAEILLEVDELCAGFDTEEGYVRVLDRVSFRLEAGATLGLVGESGCGKSVTALSVMGLLPHPAGHVESGSVRFRGRELLRFSSEEMRAVRGKRIAMIFQEPMTALNPVQRVGRQLGEAIQLHAPSVRSEGVRARAVQLLSRVGIPVPERRLRDYPHELSGGMRQRVMIAMALASSPDLLIADEPTTALDVTIQAQILDLLRELQADTGMAIIFITHDLGVVAEMCREVAVMYAGRIVEDAAVEPLFAHPVHPYTRGLLNSIPRLDTTPKSELNIIAGVVPALNEMPSGCRFRNRCEFARTRCAEAAPELRAVTPGHRVGCIRANEFA
jgi:peptide/nickel transport system ATP-binding protein